ERTLPGSAERRDANADRDPAHRFALFGVALHLADFGADSLGDVGRSGYLGFGHNDAELIPRKPGRHVDGAYRAPQRVGCFDQHLVGTRVAIQVVISLEPVDVDYHERQWSAVPFRPFNLLV